ncbi:MAG: patatin-like phospholipase family protein [Neobacillus sp.]|jgi:NTE family protein
MKIDGVFSGGGIKGLALIGAFEELEKRGFSFVRVAGTSAGSIIAALIAAGYTSREIYQLYEELDFNLLMDPRKSVIPFPFAKWLFVFWRLGLYRGVELEKWIEEKLAAKGLRTFAQLPPQSLRVVASDLSNGRLVVLPDDLVKYGISPGSFSIAKAIRMSCSIPYFFEPVKLKCPEGVNVLVDGAVLSNFPMWLFDKENVKKVRPVIGIQLSPHEYEHEKHKIKNGIHLFTALFETMMDAHDTRYISRKHAKNIIFVKTEGVVATEFNLTDEKKQLLLNLGKDSAQKFFKSWSY